MEKGWRQLQVFPLLREEKGRQHENALDALVIEGDALTKILNGKDKMMENDRETSKRLDPGMLIDKLWQTTVETASPAEIGPRCEDFLRAWNFLAVERMETEGRLTPEDLATAEHNLRSFIQLMKTEAVFLGHASRLDQDCFQAAHRRLERRSVLSQFTLWPYWPNSVAVKGGQ